jgi:hypothetical protein
MAAPPVPPAEPVAEPAAEATTPPLELPLREPPQAQPVVPEPPVKAHVNPFLARDPRQKARRLARALVSDIIVYQPEKRQQALVDGTLKTAFEDEIKKSWEEYVEQVGHDIADSTPYFTEALNEILAGGQQVF